MAELGKAYVQIVPSAQGISGSISKILGGESASAGASAGQSLGTSLVSSLKGVLAAAGVGTLLKETLDAGGDLQQSFGGLDTLYGDAAEAAKKYASEAAKAGISANTYAEQAVSFGASLKQAFGGDTTKAMEAANTAILDMADNSAKMGTEIGMIQNAYAGFSKQNYTMLDNLKLGYGGTKTEMERLLADAEKLSGVHYDIDNLGDVYAGIHVIQENLGLTGVAAEEASETFSGSMNAMKASAQNVLANLALGEDIRPSLQALGTSVRAFLINNLFPMVGNIFSALPDALGQLNGIALSLAQNVIAELPETIDMVVTTLGDLFTTILASAPYWIEAAYDLIMGLVDGFMSFDWVTFATNLIQTMKDNLDLAAGEIFGQDSFILDDILATMTEALPNVLSLGVSIVQNLINGALSVLPNLLAMSVQIIQSFAGYVFNNLPTILQSGADILNAIIQGIAQAIPMLLTAAINLLSGLAGYVLENLPTIIETGTEIIVSLVSGLTDAIVYILEAMPEIIASIVDAFAEFDWITVGKNIIQGVVNGVKAMAKALYDAIVDICKQAFQSVKDFFGIASPSKLMRDEVGVFLPSGIAVGAEMNEKALTDEMQHLAVVATDSFNPSFDSIEVARDSKTDAILELLARYLPDCAKDVVIDGNSLLDGIDRGLGMEGALA